MKDNAMIQLKTRGCDVIKQLFTLNRWPSQSEVLNTYAGWAAENLQKAPRHMREYLRGYLNASLEHHTQSKLMFLYVTPSGVYGTKTGGLYPHFSESPEWLDSKQDFATYGAMRYTDNPAQIWY